MNITLRQTRIATTVALLFFTASAATQAESNAFVSPPAGSYHPSWYLLPSYDAIDPDSRFGIDEYGFGIGLRVGMPIAQMLDVQIGTSWTRTWGNSSTLRRNAVGADVLYMFSRERFRPFVLAGGGVEFNKLTSPSRNSDDTAGFINLGVGVQHSFTDQLGMQADLRRTYSFLSSRHFGFNHATNNILSVGLTYAFEKPEPPARQVAVSRPPPAPPVVASPPPPPPLAARAEPMPPPAAPVAAPPPRFLRYALSATELFGFDSSQLQGSQPKLDEIATLLNNNQQVSNVDIIGYSDRLGAPRYNMELSQRRADVVKEYLIARGVQASRLSAVGRGEANPVVECNDRRRSALILCLEPNRRVEVEEIVVQQRVQ